VNLTFTRETEQLIWALSRSVAAGAAYNAEERYPPPRCLPGTRERILDAISQWFETGMNQVCWLYGAPGMGKSAVAQTIAETYAKRDQLVASFFLSRSDSKNRRFPTTAGDIALSTAVRWKKMGDIFSSELIARLLSDSPRRPMLIVVDGLDECDDSYEQCLVLSDIRNLLCTYHQVLPLRFLITSRPYSHIQEMFKRDTLAEISTCISLDDVDGVYKDVFNFLQSEFTRIGHSSGRKDSLQVVREPWPSADLLHRLAIESGGSFRYAATLVNYVDSSPEQLDRILSMEVSRPTSTNLSGLDKLYLWMLDQLSVSHLAIVKRVLGFALFPDFSRAPVSLSQIPGLLGLSPENMMSRLDDLGSIIHLKHRVTGRYFWVISPFEDFLSNRSLSQEYHIDFHQWQADTLRDMLRSESARARVFDLETYALHHPQSCLELTNSSVKISSHNNR